jgi:UDP-N-acetylmuramate dehydrogenase
MHQPDYILENISLRQYSWFGTGGNARYFLAAKNDTEFTNAVAWAAANQIPLRILGQGANILIADEGFNGLIVRMPQSKKEFYYLDYQSGILHVDAGFDLQYIIEYAIKEALLFGLEEFSGIPSSIGAAIFINLHYYEFFIAQFVYEVTIYDVATKSVRTISKESCQFGYDDSIIKKNNQYVVLSASFLLKRGSVEDSWYAQGRRKEIIRHRQNRYPHYFTCGCFFKNFSKDTVGLVTAQSGRLITAASYYLDRAQVRDCCHIGDVSVSWQHANMIVHTGKATSADIITVARIMQEKVYEKFGLFLEPECELLGYSQYPLHTRDTLTI